MHKLGSVHSTGQNLDGYETEMSYGAQDRKRCGKILNGTFLFGILKERVSVVHSTKLHTV